MATALPPTTKSWIATSTGPPSSATLTLQTRPSPALPPPRNSILLRVTHAALNPVDLHFLANLPAWLPFRRQPTPAFDFAGTVVALGPGVPPSLGLATGDHVAGALGARQVALGVGTLTELLCVPAELVAKIPAGWDGGAAAGMFGIAGQTAAVIVRAAGELEGRRVLINGASGGVGTVLTQAVKGKGAVTVVGVCSGANAEMVRRLGADEVVDYTACGEKGLEGVLTERFGGEAERFDFIFDCAGGQKLYERSPGYLKERGRFISIVGGKSQGIVPFVRNKLRPVVLGGTPRAYDLLALMPSGVEVKEVAAWVDGKVVKEMPVDGEYAMEDAVKAYEKLATKHAKGKIIVKVSA